MSTIFRKELVSQVAKTTGKTQKLTDTVLDATLDAIVENLKKGNEVRISGFFSFLIKEREERHGLTPKHKVPYVKPAYKATKVLVGKKLKGLKNLTISQPHKSKTAFKRIFSQSVKTLKI